MGHPNKALLINKILSKHCIFFDIKIHFYQLNNCAKYLKVMPINLYCGVIL